MFKKLLSVAFIVILAPLSVMAQTGVLTGTVTDQSTGEFLTGASVQIVELQTGGFVGIDGVYRVTNIPVGSYTVRVSYVGYRTVSNTVNISAGENTYNVQMRLDATGLDEVVVTGVGNIERQAFTGAASTVRNDRFANVPVASVDQALRGAAPGLTVNAATGTPGAVQQIRIRGISSVNAGVAPLFVIDGVPVVSGSNASSTATSSFGIMASLNPNDIESITVLKDAAATAPYGARGSNGVIVITTKQGRQGRTEYTASYQRGVNSRAVDGEQPMDAFTRLEIFQQMFPNGIGGNPVTNFAAIGQPWDGESSFNWVEETTNEGAVQQDFYVAARGGTQTTNFYVSGSAFTQEGHTIGSSLDRLTGKVDVTHRFDQRVRISNSMQASFAEQDGYLEGGGFFGNPNLAGYFFPANVNPRNADGTPNIGSLGVPIFNPLYIQENDINRKRTYRFLNNTRLELNLADNFMVSSRFSVDFVETVEKYYRNRAYGDAVNFNGSVNDINNRNINWVWQNMATYLYNLDANNAFTFRLIAETQRNTYEGLSATGRGIAADGLFNLNTTATPFSVGGATSDWGIQSFTGLVNYGFREKLYTDLSFRYEGNSRFAPDERWGSFWSVGMAYVLTQENFFRDLGFLDYARVRASYGKTGNASIGLNLYQATVGFGAYAGQPSILNNNLGNQALTWETAHSLDLALEFEVLQRLSGSVTYFRKNSENLLFSVPLSRTTGHTSQQQNIGELYNQGIELELNLNLVRTRDFSWNLGGNYTFIENEVTKLPVDGDGNPITITTATRYIAVEGYAVNTWYMRSWAGVNPENGNPMWWRNIVDAEGNITGRETTSVYSQASLYDQGATALPKVFGSFNTRVDFRGVYASATMYYAFGYKIYDDWAGFQRGDGANFTWGQYARQADRWQQPGDIAENPRPVWGGNMSSNQASSRFLYKGDHLRLQDLRVGYNIPVTYLEGTGLTAANVYFLGTNLWTYAFDKNLNHDPAVPADGFTSLLTPPLRSFTFGVSLNF
jgi:TonB-linked SusC/RagA family outer membrane protein